MDLDAWANRVMKVHDLEDDLKESSRPKPKRSDDEDSVQKHGLEQFEIEDDDEDGC